MEINQFIEELKKMNIDINEKQLEDLEKYYNILIEENKKYNLTTITEKNMVYLKHFYDSLTMSKAIKLNNQSILDIGTGAGFPGIVIKIIYPDTKVFLLDSTEKRCKFLEKVINVLDLKEIFVINARAEEYTKENREKFDIVTSRAVAPLKHLLEYSIPALKVEGIFIALKSNIIKELNNIENYYKKLFLDEEKIIQFKLPIEESLRNIYIIKKKNKTPIIYPRSYSQIKKKEI